MAKKTPTIQERDYGRRMYASKKKYGEQRKLTSDFYLDIAAGKQKHSEFKRPYIPDLDYPEMEMYNPPPWNPNWPGLPPGEPPVIGPVDPGGPVPIRPTDPRKLPPFNGCLFWPGIFKPNPVSPGDISFGEVWIGSQDSITKIECYGPGKCVFALDGCNEKTFPSGRPDLASGPGKCTILVHADKDYDPSKGDAVVITVYMASGVQCATAVYVEPCDPETPGPVYDWSRNPQTIANSGSATIYIIDPVDPDNFGDPPFTWTVSGTGFSFPVKKTSGRSNTIVTNSSPCGTGRITVRDVCGKSTTGYIRAVSGTWSSVSAFCIPECQGTDRPGDGYCIYGKHRMSNSYPISLTCGGGCGCGNCVTQDCAGRCDDTYGSIGCIECFNFYPPAGETGDFPCSVGADCGDGRFQSVNCYASNIQTWEWVCS
jgi:hypothetical protein